MFIRLTRYKLLIIIIHGACFMFQVPADGLAKTVVSDPVCRKGSRRHKTPGNLVFALGAGLEALQALFDTVIDA